MLSKSFIQNLGTTKDSIKKLPNICEMRLHKLEIYGPFGWRSEKVGEWKISERIEIFGFLSCVFGWRSGKMGGWKTFLFDWREEWEDRKCSLYKLTIMSLLYNI